MIKYHGTPVGGTRDGTVRFLAGRDCLVPWKRPDDLWAAKTAARSFIVDNSAFTAWKSGEPITDWQPYYEWVESIYRHPSFQWAIIPDVIDGSEGDNDVLLSEWPEHLPGVPVWHYHESLERLEFLVDSYPRICLGSSGQWPNPGTNGWWERTAEVMAVCCDENGNPRTRLHGLRMLNPDIFSKIPLASADSTNAAQNGTRKAQQVGLVSSWQGQVIIAWGIEQETAAEQWVYEQQPMLFQW